MSNLVRCFICGYKNDPETDGWAHVTISVNTGYLMPPKTHHHVLCRDCVTPWTENEVGKVIESW